MLRQNAKAKANPSLIKDLQARQPSRGQSFSNVTAVQDGKYFLDAPALYLS